MPDTSKVVQPEFKGNVGISGQVFNEDPETGSPYFALTKNDPKWKGRFELSKLHAPYDDVKTPKGGVVKVSIYADKRDLELNLSIGKKIADQLNFDVEIRPHVDNNIIKHHPNPEFNINNKIADLKSPEGKRQSNLLRKANRQGCIIVAYDMQNLKLDESTYFVRLANSLSSNAYPNIKEIIIIKKDGTAMFWNRTDFVKSYKK